MDDFDELLNLYKSVNIVEKSELIETLREDRKDLLEKLAYAYPDINIKRYEDQAVL